MSGSYLEEHFVASFLTNPLILRGSSVIVHLLLLLGLVCAYICIILRRKPATATTEQSEDETNLHRKNKNVVYLCLGLSIYNLVLCVWDYFFWLKSGFSDENLVALFDLASRVFAWFLVFGYLKYYSNGNWVKFPLLLRIWWWIYLAVSTCCSVMDILECIENPRLPVQVLVSDAVYVISGIFFCCAGMFGKDVRGDNTNSSLAERLLDDDGSNVCDPDPRKNILSPYSNAGFFSSLTFAWVGSLIAEGYNKTLDLDDVPALSGKEDVNESCTMFRNFLESERKDPKNVTRLTTMQLANSLVFTMWGDILWTGFYCLLYILASFVGPYLIDSFVQYLHGERKFKIEAFVLVSAFFVGKVVECVAQRHWFYRLQVVEVRAKAVLIERIYRKALTLSCLAKQGQTSGEMINLMSVDVERIGEFSWFMHDPWMIILQLTLALMILYKNLGLASIASLVTTLIIMLFNFPLSTFIEKYQAKLMESKDKRMKATSEILKNMRILKCQAWEMKLLSKIVDIRNVESGWLKKFLYILAVMTCLFYTSPIFVSVVTFTTCTIIGIPLESGRILTALATFGILQDPIYGLPDMISACIQTKVSLDRIASFLSLDDLDPDTIERLPQGTSDEAIDISDGNFSWDATDLNLNLKNINLKVHQGMRVAVCGTVGSGKSTLLSCILGEVPKISGIIRLNGSTAYVPQSPWIQSGKIVDNILFGREMDAGKYDRVLQACALKKDLEMLSFGDQTIIGERGINLSGGQKQRIQIARALYQDADIYIFDDPFSAVDAHTGSHLFKECLLGFLQSKTVIYVTHQMEFLPAADQILVMKDGRILQAGKYDDILSTGTDFLDLVGAHEQAMSGLNASKPPLLEDHADKISIEEEINDNLDDEKEDNKKLKGQLVEEEERVKGRVALSVYWKYLTTAYGGALIPFILLAQLFFQILQILSNYWIAWATPGTSDVEPTVDSSTLILVYVSLSIGSAFCVLARALLLVTSGYKSAIVLFSKMHTCIFRAPMSFFDATPSGRILNRASTDQSAVDMSISNQVGAVAFRLIQLIGIILVMSLVAWQVFLIFIPVTAISIWYQQYYLPSARELSRLVGVTKAPVIQHFAETISGATTIRSFNQQPRFCEISSNLINGNSRPKFYNVAAVQWLTVRLDLLSSITFACCLIFLVSIPSGLINPGIAGLAVIYGLTLNTVQMLFIRDLCNMENKIISVERILQYTCIPNEPPLVIEENRPHSSWPSCGEIRIQDLKVRYALHMPLVLQGISCTFQGGKKTAIVGRTGSGKSTLIQTLFRLVEPAAGMILIDGTNISTIGLHDLRSKLSIIPQDPTMFEGTMRSNLDPLEEYTDDQIWEALDKCQLGEEVRKKEGKLDSVVTENGENWSMGQRQLVCLGRVLLKKSKVLVLDEATASVDTATDNLMQHTLRQHFSDSTVIVIAHRITSVIDSDLVVLLSDGLVEECDSPLRLLENKSSSFSKLVTEYATRSSSREENAS